MPVARQPEGPADAAGTWSQRELESAALPALDSSAKWGYQPLRALPPGIAEQLHAVQTESILRASFAHECPWRRWAFPSSR